MESRRVVFEFSFFFSVKYELVAWLVFQFWDESDDIHGDDPIREFDMIL